MLKLKVCGGGQVEGVIWRNVKLKKDGEGNGSIGMMQPKKSLCANMRRG